MKHVIKLAEEHDAEGFYLLITSGAGVALSDNTYIVADDQLRLLEQRGIPFTEISRESEIPLAAEGATLERI